MSKVIVNKDSLTDIGEAIREKNGEDTKYKPSEMGEAIRNISGGGNGSTAKITLNCLKEFDANGKNTDFINENFDNIILENVYEIEKCYYNDTNIKKAKFIGYPNYGFYGCTNLEEAIGVGTTSYTSGIQNSGYYAFYNCTNLKKVNFSGGISTTSTDTSSTGIYSYKYMFYNCNNLEEITFSNYPSTRNNTKGYMDYMFYNCYKLKDIDSKFLACISGTGSSSVHTGGNLTSKINGGTGSHIYDGCLSLRKINNYCYVASNAKGSSNSSAYDSAFKRTAMLSDFIFSSEKITDNLSTRTYCYYYGFTIDLTTSGYSSTDEDSAILTELYGPPVTTDEEYEAHKNDEDWWTNDPAYSRFNYDSMFKALTYLPPTMKDSAGNKKYNTIKFKSGAGSKTDGGEISLDTSLNGMTILLSSLSDYGWTVSLVN